MYIRNVNDIIHVLYRILATILILLTKKIKISELNRI